MLQDASSMGRGISNFFEDLFEKTYLSLTYLQGRESYFNELFPVGTVYDNSDRQKESYKDS